MRSLVVQWLLGAAVLLALAVQPARGAENPAPGDAYDGNWHFSLSPYVWVPGVTSDLGIPGGGGSTVSVHTSAGDILRNLKFGIMATGEARTGQWVFFSDLIYVKLGSSGMLVRTVTGPNGLVQIPVNISNKLSLEEAIVTFGLGRSIYHDENSSADWFLGERYFGMKAGLDFSFASPLNPLPVSGQLRNSGHVWDTVVGVKGRYGFADSPWFIAYYGDVGTGQAPLTGQMSVGPGYRFGWGDVFLTFRYLHYSGSGAKLIQGIDMYGPALGATFYL